MVQRRAPEPCTRLGKEATSCLRYPNRLACSTGGRSPLLSEELVLISLQINLRHGIQRGESVETCKSTCLFHACNDQLWTGTAGAGSLILEFATLSRLTGDERFEKVAHKAFFALWNRKSDVGLVGNTVNTWTGVSGCGMVH